MGGGAFEAGLWSELAVLSGVMVSVLSFATVAEGLRVSSFAPFVWAEVMVEAVSWETLVLMLCGGFGDLSVLISLCVLEVVLVIDLDMLARQSSFSWCDLLEGDPLDLDAGGGLVSAVKLFCSAVSCCVCSRSVVL